VNVLQLSKFYPPVFGGIELVEKMLTKSHSELGDEVFIVAFHKSQTYSPIGEYGESIEWINLDIQLRSAPFNFNFIFNFKSYIVKHKIQRIYVHLPNPYMHELIRFNQSFLKKLNIELIAIYHSDIVNQKILRLVYDKYFSWSAEIYNKIVVSSDNLWTNSKVLTKLPNSMKRVVPFCSEGLLNFNERKKFSGKLLAIGRLVPYKGFEFLIKTIAGTDYELHIIGDGPMYEKLLSIKSSNIFLHKKLDEEDKNKLIEDSDLLIVSSLNKSEAYGLIIVEAFESGLPVIASNIKSGVTFLVQENITGKVFEPENEKQLLECIKYYKNNEEDYMQTSKNVRAFYDQRLSFNVFKNGIENL
jgi:glycosyltransferase involved in cell wall biosynthesis